MILLTPSQCLLRSLVISEQHYLLESGTPLTQTPLTGYPGKAIIDHTHSHTWNIGFWLPVLTKSFQSVTICLSIIFPTRLQNNVRHITCAHVMLLEDIFPIRDVLAISNYLTWSFNNSKASEYSESILNSIWFFLLSLLCQVFSVPLRYHKWKQFSGPSV